MIGPLVHTGFLGVTGVGKSHEVKRRLSALPSSASRVVVVSPVDEWSQTSPERKGPMKDAMTLGEFKRDPMKLFERHLALALYGFDKTRPDAAASAVKLIARLQQRHQQETGKTLPFLLVLDEAGLYARACEGVLASLATLGGQHLGITLWTITQRPQLVPITVRSQWKHLVLWHLSEPADVEAATERAHDPDLAARLLALPSAFAPDVKGPYFVEVSPGVKPAAPPPQPSSAAIERPKRKSTARPAPTGTHPHSPPANPEQKEATS